LRFCFYFSSDQSVAEVVARQVTIKKFLKDAFSEEDYTTFMNHAKSYVEYPHKRLNKALFITGGEGCGKSSLVKLIKKNVSGGVHRTFAASQLQNKWTGLWVGVTLAHLEEFSNTLPLSSALQFLVACSQITANALGMKPYQYTHHINFVCTCNNLSPFKKGRGCPALKKHVSKPIPNTFEVLEMKEDDFRSTTYIDIMRYINSIEGSVQFRALINRHKFSEGFFETSGFYNAVRRDS